ncbi:hypothetical protein [Sphingomonas sp. CV7422]|uniref:hypothetical protein n=1 Tax=Sphingomonas sp. CV7422 TaxID=3018036 RepID=UPI0022FF451D|nr:hypothetical protein [Sphingomonas sp. CV7422]
MGPVEYVFSIDAFSPTSLPMARLAEYLTALSRMLGHPEHTHFLRVDPGSAELVHMVDAVDAPKVETRINDIRIGAGTKDGVKARQQLEDLLANDNAVGVLREKATGRVVLPFVGRNRPKPLTFPPFRESATIDGMIVAIGGRDTTAHATLQDGDVFHTGVEMKRDMARDLAPLLYGPTVRLHGNGRFERQTDGVWRMSDFKVERVERLDERPVTDTLAAIRSAAGNGLMDPDAYRRTASLRSQEDEDR